MDQFQEMNVDFKRSLPYQISVSGYIYAINLFVHLINKFRCACGFQNLVGKSVNGGQNLPPLVRIGLRWLSKLGVPMSPDTPADRMTSLNHVELESYLLIKSKLIN